jgi:Leucine-rich repeat (LRR) protein
LTGTFSSAMFTHLTSLEYIFLPDNRLTGTLPTNTEVWNSLSNLHILDLSMNSIQNVDFVKHLYNPQENTNQRNVSYLPKLRDLNFAFNDITGPFPSSLFQLTNLNVLLLNDNHITGTLPETLEVDTSTAGKPESVWNKFQNVSFLALGSNDIGGTIPMSLISNLKSSLRMYVESFNSVFGPLFINSSQCFLLCSAI